MTIQEALSSIHAPKGLTSILMGVMSGDYSVLPHEKGIGADFKTAEEMVGKYQKQLDECKSDWAYWSILGDLEYWKAVRNILEAGVIMGMNNLPDVPTPKMDGIVVMDQIYQIKKYGEAILAAAKAAQL